MSDFEAEADFDFVDPKQLAAVIDRLQGTLCKVLNQAKRRGDHLLAGQSPCAWVAATCSLSPTSASDRLCVGEQLLAMPKVAEALSWGQIGYQSAAVLCHFRDMGEKRELVDEEYWISEACKYSVKDLRWLVEHVRYAFDPDGFDHQIEEDYQQRFLKISESGGMFHLSGVLDREGGAALGVGHSGAGQAAGHR